MLAALLLTLLAGCIAAVAVLPGCATRLTPALASAIALAIGGATIAALFTH